MPAIDTRSGVLQHDKERATNGYTLFTPIGLFTAYLIDMSGNVVHQWEMPNELGHYAYLLDNGNLLASVRTEEGPMGLPAKGGHLIEYDWDGNLVWEHHDQYHHHDGRRLSNGNSMYIAWDPFDDALAARVRGGLPGTEKDGVIYGCLLYTSPSPRDRTRSRMPSSA